MVYAKTSNLSGLPILLLVVSNEEEKNGHTTTTLLKRGDKFGEDELATGNKRAATLMTQDRVELFVVHGDVRQTDIVKCFFLCNSSLRIRSLGTDLFFGL